MSANGPNLVNIESISAPGGRLLLSKNGAPVISFGNPWFVDPVNGNDGFSGQAPGAAFRTLQKAFNMCQPLDDIYVAPGQLDESPVLPATKPKVRLFVIGGRGSAFIEPTEEDADGLTVHADDFELYGLGCAGEDITSAVALTVTGRRFRGYGAKIEGGAIQVLLGPGTDAEVTAGDTGDGSDALFDDCEIAWGTKGIVLQGTDYGGCTQPYIRNCRFHDLTAESIGENVGSSGSAAVTFFGLNVRKCVFELDEAGAAPTKWLSLNANNANSGIVADCDFPTALNSGKNLVSTQVLWVGNKHTGGLSNGQPS